MVCSECLTSCDRLSDHWVTIFGFPTEASLFILEQFSQYGTILKHVVRTVIHHGNQHSLSVVWLIDWHVFITSCQVMFDILVMDYFIYSFYLPIKKSLYLMTKIFSFNRGVGTVAAIPAMASPLLVSAYLFPSWLIPVSTGLEKAFFSFE